MNILEILGKTIDSIISVFDDAYDKGYLLYLLVGLIGFFIIIMVWNRHLFA